MNNIANVNNVFKQLPTKPIKMDYKHEVYMYTHAHAARTQNIAQAYSLLYGFEWMEKVTDGRKRV